ncbi:MAG: YceI family protein, partial [Deltaproteobacteria bacterium]
APTTATLRVFTFKRGLLAAVGHDLRLSFGRFSGTAEDGHVTVEVATDSLTVDGAMGRNGQLEPLSRLYTAEIEANARGPKVLDCARFPRARFEGDALPDRRRIRGTLALRGRRTDVDGTLEIADLHACAVFEFAPSRCGIPPFRAMAGALKLQDRVRVEAEVTWPEGPAPTHLTFTGPGGPA